MVIDSGDIARENTTLAPVSTLIIIPPNKSVGDEPAVRQKRGVQVVQK